MSGIQDLNNARAYIRTLQLPKTFNQLTKNNHESTLNKLQALYNLSFGYIDSYQKTGFNVKNDKLYDVVYSMCVNIQHFFEELSNPKMPANPDFAMFPDFSEAEKYYNLTIRSLYLFAATDAEE